jgi:hypothetical protein
VSVSLCDVGTLWPRGEERAKKYSTYIKCKATMI